MELLATNVYRKAYRLSPVKFGFNLLTLELWKKLWASGNADFKLVASMGKNEFKMNFNLRDRIQFMAYVRGHHEEVSENLVRSLLADGGVFVDIGANIGFFSVLAARLGPLVQVFSFEPSHRNFELLQENLRLNSLRTPRLYRLALSDQASQKELVSLDSSHESGWNFIRPKGESLLAGSSVEQVSTAPLDEILENEPLPTLLKIDVEGHEHAVLKGAKRVLTAPGKRHVLIEVNAEGLKKQHTSADAIYDLLFEYGYRAYRVSRSGSLTACFDLREKSAECNFLFSKE